MSRMLIVSNRLPVTIAKKKNEYHFTTSSGGLATGLGSVYKKQGSLWIGWPGISAKDISAKIQIEKELASERMHPVFLSQRDIDKFYYGFCNETLWPLFHYFVQFAEYNSSYWESYKHVNTLYCDEVVKIAQTGDTIWIHDYHLLLLPKLIRERIPDATIGFFLHIPFPSFEIFRMLPWRVEILNGLLGADLIGFHTYDYVRHFSSAVFRLLGYESEFGQLNIENRIILIDSFPMGIDYEKFSTAHGKKKTKNEITKIKQKIGDKKIILSVDRMDYTKGIPERLEAFNLFLERYSEYVEKVTMILVTVPSRSKVLHYKLLKEHVDELVGRIAGRYDRIGWVPIVYFYRSLAFDELAAYYNTADVALVTPFRDGMNLIAKEYLASKHDGKGVLILSETAGAAESLGNSIIINPNNTEKVAEAIKKALEMPYEEIIEQNRETQNQLMHYDIHRWIKNFIKRLEFAKKQQIEMSAKFLSNKIQEKIQDNYNKSKNRLIIFDYDGTLIPFTEIPSAAVPDKELLHLLKRLAGVEGSEVVLISGRDKETLQKWLGKLPVDFVAEHGVWYKEKGSNWEMIEPLTQDWKDKIVEIFEIYVDRIPGSFIETKGYSVVWHYRKSDPALGKIRARELVETISYLTTNLNLQVLEGNKVVEVRNSVINKGRAALRWISKKEWQCILAFGDDKTDEDVFKALPQDAYSVKVGFGASAAKYYLRSSTEVRSFIKELVRE
ncbi:bifunctional alpha,alpha-trehalose-phosphate synthase (UDP-forming)/trehalose-phosphatase [candidate division KSB1 bacterium]